MLRHDDLHKVSLRGVPVEIWRRSREWFSGLIREFEIIASGVDPTRGGPPTELVRFVAEVSEKFSGFGQSEPILDQAITDREIEVDLDLELPNAAGAAATELWHLIEKADEYCRSGALLTLAIPEDVRTFAGWYLSEVARQVEGAEARPWGEGTSAP